MIKLYKFLLTTHIILLLSCPLVLTQESSNIKNVWPFIENLLYGELEQLKQIGDINLQVNGYKNSDLIINENIKQFLIACLKRDLPYLSFEEIEPLKYMKLNDVRYGGLLLSIEIKSKNDLIAFYVQLRVFNSDNKDVHAIYESTSLNISNEKEFTNNLKYMIKELVKDFSNTSNNVRKYVPPK